jgi:tetraacyldisaccharide 4'-kinase
MNIFLRTASLINRSASRLNVWLFRSGLRRAVESPLPVISVGNTGFGGYGKTPLVIHLVQKLMEKGIRPAVVIRGYRGKWERSGGVVSAGTRAGVQWREAGDEPCMIARRLPGTGVYVGKNRFRSCVKACRDGYQVVVLDDGFQHLQLKRDVDIAIHRPGDPFVRESAGSLRRADIILLAAPPSARSEEGLQDRFPDIPHFYIASRPSGFFNQEGSPADPDFMKGKDVTAFCGIAGADRFRSTLEEMGIQPGSFHAFPDHHPYPPSTLNKLRAGATGETAFITTEKDIFKIPAGALKPASLFFLRIETEIREEFINLVWEKILPVLDDRRTVNEALK